MDQDHPARLITEVSDQPWIICTIWLESSTCLSGRRAIRPTSGFTVRTTSRLQPRRWRTREPDMGEIYRQVVAPDRKGRTIGLGNMAPAIHLPSTAAGEAGQDRVPT
ncbi:hypothetical protein C2S52_016249 [Perilla frutescens var. hirtella]|nr:hypothetical protein C2S52_016249 [Perilla frutescens var. hirtella]